MNTIISTGTLELLGSKIKKGKNALSFASPEKEIFFLFIYEVITWEKFHKRAAIHYWWGLKSRFCSGARDLFFIQHVSPPRCPAAGERPGPLLPSRRARKCHVYLNDIPNGS